MLKDILLQHGRRMISLVLIVSLVLSPSFTYAQSAFVSALPVPGTMVGRSAAFTPVLVKGLVIHPDRPLNFDFIVDSGNDAADQAVIKEQSERMARYFLAAVTVPEDQLWVNLSPVEKDRIIENDLGQTVLGRDMLAQDYVLKQLTASLIYPEQGLGKEFWAKVYAEAQARFGTTDIPVDTFNKVWIMPEKAEVFENGNAVYVTQAKLKVMLESDYFAAEAAKSAGEDLVPSRNNGATSTELSKDLIRQIILPAIEKEVNEGSNFAVIRQVYHAAILAKWYRELIQNTLLSDAYVGKNRVSGVSTDEKTLKEEIYQRYIAAYRKGAFDYIKEESDPVTGESVPRKYFSGGISDFAMQSVSLSRTTDASMLSFIGKLFKSAFLMKSAGATADVEKLAADMTAAEQRQNYDDYNRASHSLFLIGDPRGDFYYKHHYQAEQGSYFDPALWGAGDTSSQQPAGWLVNEPGVDYWEKVRRSDETMVDLAASKPLDLRMDPNVAVINEGVQWIKSHPMLTAGYSKDEVDAAMGTGLLIGLIIGMGVNFVVGAAVGLAGVMTWKESDSEWWLLNIIRLCGPLLLNYPIIMMFFPPSFPYVSFSDEGSRALGYIGASLGAGYLSVIIPAVTFTLSRAAYREMSVQKKKVLIYYYQKAGRSEKIVSYLRSQSRPLVLAAKAALIAMGAQAIPVVVTAWEAGNIDRRITSVVLYNLGWAPQALDKRLVFYRAAEEWKELVKIGAPAVPVLIEAQRWDELIKLGAPAVSLLAAELKRAEMAVDYNKYNHIADALHALGDDRGNFYYKHHYEPEQSSYFDPALWGAGDTASQQPAGWLVNEPGVDYWEKVRRSDAAMADIQGTPFALTDKASDLAHNGGIDIKDIDITRRTDGARIRFNDQAVRDVLKNGFNGFTPVILNITPVESPLSIFSMN